MPNILFASHTKQFFRNINPTPKIIKSFNIEENKATSNSTQTQEI